MTVPYFFVYLTKRCFIGTLEFFIREFSVKAVENNVNNKKKKQ